MVSQSPSVVKPQIIAEGVSLEQYLEVYAERGAEYVEGDVIQMAPIGLRHEDVRDYLRLLFQFYLDLNPIGRVRGEPYVMRLPAFPKRRRQPDLMLILGTNVDNMRETFMDGPASICIEIVSPGSVSIDHGEKFQEYEQGGVPEYWIVDPLRSECRFYRLQDGVYAPQSVVDGIYKTPQLPNFVLEIAVLWQEVLPGPMNVVEIVSKMLKNKEDNNG